MFLYDMCYLTKQNGLGFSHITPELEWEDF